MVERANYIYVQGMILRNDRRGWSVSRLQLPSFSFRPLGCCYYGKTVLAHAWRLRARQALVQQLMDGVLDELPARRGFHLKSDRDRAVASILDDGLIAWMQLHRASGFCRE